MAQLLWGKVYFQEQLAGILSQEPGDRVSFTYDSTYLASGYPAIAHTLPLSQTPYITTEGLPPFFDNLVAEGWLEEAQTRLLAKRMASRFELLLAFGADCAGAVSVIDAEPFRLSTNLLDLNDPKEMAVLTSRASLSGIQPKLAIVQRNNRYYPAKIGEISTHIAKFPSHKHPDLLQNEYLTLQAIQALLPDDQIVEITIDSIEGLTEPALIIKRFDRAPQVRLHFEEFNQLLGRTAFAKYDGSYQEMAHFIHTTPGCLPVEVFRLFSRILAGLLLGNTDMHFKNFALFHTPQGMRLTPIYDMVAATLYSYKTLALAIGHTHNLQLGQLKAKHILALGNEFTLSQAAMHLAVKTLEKNKDAAKAAITDADINQATYLKNQLIDCMEKRWNGTFALIGQSLLKKP